MIVLPVKHLADGQLDPVMTGIWGMVGPAHCLFQVVRGPVINGPANQHQPEPLSQCFFICLFNAVFSHSLDGKLKPKIAQQKDWDRMNRIKSGYLKLTNAMKKLKKEDLEKIYQNSLKTNISKKNIPSKQVKVQRIAPGVSGVKGNL